MDHQPVDSIGAGQRDPLPVTFPGQPAGSGIDSRRAELVEGEMKGGAVRPGQFAPHGGVGLRKAVVHIAGGAVFRDLQPQTIPGRQRFRLLRHR